MKLSSNKPTSSRIEAAPSSSNLVASVGKNTAFGIISGGTQVATRLITIPIVIGHLGLGGYGIWSIIMTTAAYMRFGAVGVKSAFQKYVAEATGSQDYDRANKLLSTGCVVMLVLSVLVLIPISLGSNFLTRQMGVPVVFHRSTSGAISILALIMVFSNFGAVFEAVVMGGHRIDVARRFTTVSAIAEATAIVTLLHYGLGLFTMAAVMGVSEIGFVICCYFASRRVLPQIQIRFQYVTRDVIPELTRFAGSYQLVSVLQVLYAAILPITMLHSFGAESAGIYALSVRLISPAQLLQDAFLLSILSGGAMLYASGATEKMGNLLHKSFRVTFTFSLIPMSLIALFGATIVLAWTGQKPSALNTAVALVALAGTFQAVSILGLVLYRISGNAVLDNVRQGLMLITLCAVASFSHRLGFYGVLVGLAIAEFLGMVFMIYAVARTFYLFRISALLEDAFKVAAAAALIITVAIGIVRTPWLSGGGRETALIQTVAIVMTSGVLLLPVLVLTGVISRSEIMRVLRGIVPVGQRRSTIQGEMLGAAE